MDFSKFVEWVFYGLIGGGVYVIAEAMASMNKSMIQLNINLATVIEKVSSHEKSLDDHHERIRDLEKQKV